jgi:hypothetical protein
MRVGFVMPGLVPGIHAVEPGRRLRIGNSGRCNIESNYSTAASLLGVDGRDKPGHDGAVRQTPKSGRR